jgi:hypothetical protein
VRTSSSSPASSVIRIVILLALVLAFAVGAATPAMALTKRQKAAIKIIKTAAKSKKLNSKEISALLKICKRESTYSPTEVTGSCKGLFQLKTSYPRSKWANARWNTLKAIKYIKARYGSCRAALSHSYRYGWY